MAKTVQAVDAAADAKLKRVMDVWTRADKGDKSAAADARALLADPDLAGLVCLWGGELAEQAERAYVEALVGKHGVSREAVCRKLELMRAELAGPDPTPVERLLVERVVACWLQVQDADVRYAGNQADFTMVQGDYSQRRQDRAHKRYLSALRTLALVRKLALPALQVNIAKKQINVAGPCAVAGGASGQAAEAPRGRLPEN